MFYAVKARIARLELWTAENALLEIAKCARQMKLIPLAVYNYGNDLPPPAADPGLTSAEVEAEEQLSQFSANADTWYNNSDTVLLPVLQKYKIPTLPSMYEFTTVLDSWLGGTAHERTVWRELAQA